MDFSSACCRSVMPSDHRLRRWLAGCLLLLPTLVLARGIVLDADSHLADRTLVLSARASIALDADVIEALDSGITLHFVLEGRLSRSNRFWLDARVAQTRREFAVTRHALSNRYSVVETGSTRAQTFSSVEEAFSALGELPEVLSVEREKLQAGAAYIARVRLKLETDELPSPMRPVVWLSPAWWVSSGWHEWTLMP